MKFVTTILIVVSSVCGVAACKKANKSQPPVVVKGSSPTYMQANIGNANFYSDSIRAFAIPYYHDSGIYSLTISANKYSGSNNDELTFYINYYTGKGTYPINPPNNYATYYRNNSRYYASSGQIMVTTDSSGYVKGTFNFSSDSVTVTNGIFSVGK